MIPYTVFVYQQNAEIRLKIKVKTAIFEQHSVNKIMIAQMSIRIK